MRRRLFLALLLSLPTACASSPDAELDPCARAVAAVTECLGAEVEAPFGAECAGDDALRAEGLLTELEQAGCEGPAGKADGFFCGAWDPLGWCRDPMPPLGPTPQGEPAAYPILLAHGFNTSTTNFWRFNDVDVALRADGHDVVLGSVPPFQTPEVRATYLARQVDELLAQTGAARVNLICFSQGGVDCRYLASPNGLGYGDRIASVTTISSPHRGTYVADTAVAVLPRPDSATGRIVELIVKWYGGTFSSHARDSAFADAMRSMSEAHMVEFNQEIVDDPRVYYQSWAGFSYVAGLPNPRDSLHEICRDDDGVLQLMWHDGQRDVMDALLTAAAPIVAHGTELRPNDGVSTVESAKWGVFRGCIPADHLDQVGQIRDRGTDRRTGFDYLRFYRNIAFELASRGF